MSASVCVCLSVCVSVCPQAYLLNHTRDLYQFFVHVAYRRGSVLLRRGGEIPRGRGSFGVFFPTDNALYGIAFGTHAKTAEPIEMSFIRLMTRVRPRYRVLDRTRSPKGKWQFLGENVADHCKVIYILSLIHI